MIDKEQLNIDWINKVSKSHRNADNILVEKVIRALLLLEGLSESEIPFVFKGGTSLMLHFNSSKRLSVYFTPKVYQYFNPKVYHFNLISKSQNS
jgi:hypothetical protein